MTELFTPEQAKRWIQENNIRDFGTLLRQFKEEVKILARYGLNEELTDFLDFPVLVDIIDQKTMFTEKSWGNYQVVNIDDDSITIKVTLNARHRMNYHSHQRRDEVWVVISGEGRTIVDGMEQTVRAGDVVIMQAGCRHTIISDTTLRLIEVQLGKDISVHDKCIYKLEK